MSKEVFESGYDLYLVAAMSGNSATLQTCETTLKGMGLTTRQIEQMKHMAVKCGVQIPETKEVQTKVDIHWEKKVDKLDDRNKFQSVADQFLLFIYGVKFNDGVNGAFGVAQNIRPEAKKHTIYLFFPESYKQLLEGDIRFAEKSIKRIQSSINHYQDKGCGTVVVRYE